MIIPHLLCIPNATLGTESFKEGIIPLPLAIEYLGLFITVTSFITDNTLLHFPSGMGYSIPSNEEPFTGFSKPLRRCHVTSYTSA